MSKHSTTSNRSRRDRRGITWPDSVRGEQFLHCDFSTSRARGAWVEGCLFEDSVFAKTDLRELKEHANEFRRCRFQECDFSGAGLGFFTSRYDECTFERCRFRDTSFGNAVFRDCKFLGPRLKDIDFNASGFWRTKFDGLLEDIWFRGTYAFANDRRAHTPIETGLHQVDFQDARLAWITVSDGCELEELILPRDGSAVIIDTAQLNEDVVGSLAADLPERDRETCNTVLASYRLHAGGQRKMIASLADFIGICGDSAGRRLFDRLKRVAETDQARH